MLDSSVMDDTPSPNQDPKYSNDGPGEDMAWAMISTLLAGPIVWGGLGALVDQFAGTNRVFLPLGVVLGFVTSIYIVYVRFGRDN